MMQPSFEIITPAIARDMLQTDKEVRGKYNVLPVNRPILKKWVRTLKHLMANDRFIDSPESTSIGERGEIWDGQHRLTAISQMPEHMRFTLLVVRNVPGAVFPAMNQGRIREKHIAAGEGPMGKKLTEVANLIAFVCYGPLVSAMAPDIKPIIERIRPYHDDLTDYAPTAARTWSTKAMRTAAVVTLMEGKVDPRYVKSVYRAFTLLNYNELPEVAHALMRAIDTRRVKPSDWRALYARALVVFDPRNAHHDRVFVRDANEALERVRALFRDIAPEYVEPEPPAPATPAAASTRPIPPWALNKPRHAPPP